MKPEKDAIWLFEFSPAMVERCQRRSIFFMSMSPSKLNVTGSEWFLHILCRLPSKHLRSLYFDFHSSFFQQRFSSLKSVVIYFLPFFLFLAYSVLFNMSLHGDELNVWSKFLGDCCAVSETRTYLWRTCSWRPWRFSVEDTKPKPYGTRTVLTYCAYHCGAFA